MTKSELARRIGANVRRLRERKGWSQQRLAEASGLRQPNVARLEAGTHPPALWTAWVVAEALGVPLADLVAE